MGFWKRSEQGCTSSAAASWCSFAGETIKISDFCVARLMLMFLLSQSYLVVNGKKCVASLSIQLLRRSDFAGLFFSAKWVYLWHLNVCGLSFSFFHLFSLFSRRWHFFCSYTVKAIICWLLYNKSSYINCFSLKTVVKSSTAHCFLLVWKTFLLAYAMLFYQIVFSSSDITKLGL